MADTIRSNLDHDQLRQEIAAGSHVAFATLVLHYRPGLFRFVRRCAPSLGVHEAEDVVQDTFCRLWEHRQRLFGAGSLRSLLWAIAGNVVAYQMRRGGLRVHAPLQPDMPSATPSPQQQASVQELMTRLDTAMGELTDLQREALKLHSQGLSAQEIATRLGCTVKAVECRLTAARKALKGGLHLMASSERKS